MCGHDDHGDRRRGASLCRPLHGRVHRSSAAKRGTRFEALEPIRQGIGRTLRGHRRRRGLWAAAASRPRAIDATCRRFSTARSSASKVPELRGGSPKATASRSASTAEGESVVGAELRDHRGLRLALLAFKPLQRAGEIRLSKPRPRCDATSSGWTRQRRVKPLAPRRSQRGLREYSDGLLVSLLVKLGSGGRCRAAKLQVPGQVDLDDAEAGPRAACESEVANGDPVAVGQLLYVVAR